MRTYEIPEDDWKELMELSAQARRTPVMALSVRDGLEGRDFAAQARERVLRKWREIGERLGFDGETVEPVDQAKRLVRARPLKPDQEADDG